MQMARIRFADKDRARGFVELARRIKMICLPGEEYLIAEPNLQVLDRLGISYQVVGTEGFDSAIGKVRDSAPVGV